MTRVGNLKGTMLAQSGNPNRSMNANGLGRAPVNGDFYYDTIQDAICVYDEQRGHWVCTPALQRTTTSTSTSTSTSTTTSSSTSTTTT